MTTKETGGHAFPTPDSWNPNGDLQPGDAGMGLRDYFAAKAMQGMLANADYAGSTKVIVLAAYATADAMIEARK